MTTRSDRLGLNLHSDADVFDIGEWTENFTLIDASPGALISETLPNDWGNDQIGRLVVEPSTGITRVFKGGSVFERLHGRGLLATSTRATPISTTSTTFTDALTAAVVASVQPDRPIIALIECPAVRSSVGITEVQLQQVGPGSTRTKTWTHKGGVSGSDPWTEPEPLNAWALWMQGSEGSGQFRFLFRAMPGFGGTSTIDASAGQPCTLYVVEL